MAERAESDILNGDALVHTCIEVIQSLLCISKPQSSEIRDIRSKLEDLKRLLDSLRPIESRKWVQTILEECRIVLKQISVMMIRDLAYIQNQLCLASNLSLCNEDLRDEVMIKTVQKGLDTISQELMASGSAIVPLSPLATGNKTFELREATLFGSEHSISHNTSSKHEIICSNCSFHELKSVSSTRNFKFACLCPTSEGSHDGELNYKVLPSTFLVEHICPLQARRWQMVLSKLRDDSRVSIIISETKHTNAHDIEAFAKHLASLLSHGFTTDSSCHRIRLKGDNIFRMGTVSPPEAFFSRLPWRFELKSPGKTATLDWKVRHVQLKHYLVAQRTEMETKDQSVPTDFHPQSSVELCIQGESHRRQANLGHFEISVIMFKDSVFTSGSAENPLCLTMSKIEIRSIRGVSEVNIHFNNRQDVEIWMSYILAFRQRLLQIYVQQKFAFERQVYHQESATCLQMTDQKSYSDQGITIRVISSRPDDPSKAQFRMLCTRPGAPGSLCLEFGSAIAKIAQQGLHGSLDLVNFWRFEIGGIQGPFLEQTNWIKLNTRAQSRKNVAPSRRDGPQILSRRDVSSEDWMDKIDDLKSVMGPLNTFRHKHKPVKVCIIDTGFHPKDRNSPKVKRFKDFVDPMSTEMCDNTWHGTTSASIILSIYEECELYVARVFRSDDTDDKTEPELMAQAIEWSIAPDVDVDIISISAGFLHHSPRLQEAAQKASAASKLIFAAASNWGNLGPVAFPARHDLYTICVFSTDTHNKASKFNPERRPDAHNFAILGEDFEHPRDAKQRVSGTSASTAAAAGLAALIIDFSRQPDNIGAIVRVADVSKMLGMIAIFNFISVRAAEFKCIKPQKLLPVDYHARKEQANRDYVRESLRRAMEQAN